MKEKKLHDWRDWQAAAQRRLPRFAFDFIEGGAGEEDALRHNREAFRHVCVTPGVLRGTAAVDTSLTLFGMKQDLPLAIAPTGLNGLICPGGDALLARAAAANAISFVLSTAANQSLEAVTEAAGQPPWFQLYMIDAATTAALVERARRVECPVLVVTVDVPVSGHRLRDARNGLRFPLRRGLPLLRHFVSRPAWTLAQARAHNAHTFPLLDGAGHARLFNRAFDPGISWNDIARLRDQWKGAMIIKGILHEDDAAKAAQLGMDGIIVSNHGGRQLAAAPPPLSVLTSVAAAAKGMKVLMDGGIRSGEDIVKALALGADAVLIGRLALYGLAANGVQGVSDVLSLLKSQLTTTMHLMGCADIESVKKARTSKPY